MRKTIMTHAPFIGIFTRRFCRSMLMFFTDLRFNLTFLRNYRLSFLLSGLQSTVLSFRRWLENNNFGCVLSTSKLNGRICQIFILSGFVLISVFFHGTRLIFSVKVLRDIFRNISGEIRKIREVDWEVLNFEQIFQGGSRRNCLFFVDLWRGFAFVTVASNWWAFSSKTLPGNHSFCFVNFWKKTSAFHGSGRTENLFLI